MSDITPADILAQMPHKELTLINGEPAYENICALREDLYQNFSAITCCHSHNNGHLDLVMRDPTYNAKFSKTFTAIEDLRYYPAEITSNTPACQ